LLLVSAIILQRAPDRPASFAELPYIVIAKDFLVITDYFKLQRHGISQVKRRTGRHDKPVRIGKYCRFSRLYR
jgi:hypothetical protein